MSICEICFIKDKLNICPKCSRNVCSLCIKLSDCDLCILIEMKFAFQYQQHNLQIEEQEFQLKQINEKLNTLNQEISLIQKANSLLNKNQNEKCQQLEFQMSQTIIDKQHEFEDIETEIENQKVKYIYFSMILVYNANEELNELKIQQLKLSTQNKELDLKINEAEKEYEVLQETLNLKKQQIYQILQTLKNKTSLIKGSLDEKHYSQSNLAITLTGKQQKIISGEEKSQNPGLCTGQCLIQ
ncbi:unnamed protein product [Paramecium pentaurelia]|uniref:Uncharacterized protein n=1 Tax=Paramecium pentaurelia TaxID=43138 RepID=A0A8S1U0U6_9CILI|nr:unnamed protein product [Paramecium pentaurelia]